MDYNIINRAKEKKEREQQKKMMSDEKSRLGLSANRILLANSVVHLVSKVFFYGAVFLFSLLSVSVKTAAKNSHWGIFGSSFVLESSRLI